MASTATAASATADRSEVGLYRYMQEYDNPRMSMTFSHSKGLLNAPGQNNCFLNSAVQVFWHLDVFRRNFRHLSGHACMGHSCIFCALKVIFTQFQHSDKGAQPPDPLRRALAHTFANQQRFQLGYMDDAAECFENILLRIHTHIAPDEKEDQCRAKHCIPHQKFSLAITEQVACRCGALSDPFSYNEMVFYVSTSALVTEAMASYQANPSSWGNFARLLKDTVAKGDTRSCPRSCGARCEKKRILTNHPDVVSIGLVWDSAKSGAEHIQDVVGCVGTSLRLQELFHNSATPDAVKHSTVLNLVGVVCYYGKHYSTFFYHSKVEEWIYFDDASVKQVSPNWEDVVDRIVRGRHQPLLLLYMNPHSQQLSVDTAPQCTELVPGYKWQEEAAAAAAAEQLSEANAAAGLKCAEDASSRSSGSLSSLPPPPPGFEGSGDGGFSATSSSAAPPVLGGVSKRLLQQQTSSEPTAAAAWATPVYPYKNGLHDPSRQLDDRDSGADEGSYTDLDRQSSLVSTDDTASSYSSRASGSSSSYVGERDQRGHRDNYGRTSRVLASSASDRVKDVSSSQDKVRMRKKKQQQRAAGQGSSSSNGMSSSSRCLSAVSLTSAESEEGGSKAAGRDSGLDSFPGNPPGYATLPRKKKVKSIAATDELSRHVDWIKEVAKKSEQLHQPAAASATAAESQDVRDRIRQFNGLGGGGATSASVTVTTRPPPAGGHQSAAAAARSSAAGQHGEASLRPAALPLYGDGAPPLDEGYIDRSSVERLIRQQRSATSAGPPTKERAGSVVTAAAAALASDLTALRVTTATGALPNAAARAAAWRGSVVCGVAQSSDAVSVGSLKDSGYRSGAGGSGSGDRTSVSSAGSGSLYGHDVPAAIRPACAPDDLGSSRGVPPTTPPSSSCPSGGRPGGAATAVAPVEGRSGSAGCKPSSASAFGADESVGEDDESFPPPPSEQELRHIGWHSKQASQGSLSSETSTLRSTCTARPGDSGGDDVDDDDCRSCSGASTSSSSRKLGGGGRPAERAPPSGDVCDSLPTAAAVASAFAAELSRASPAGGGLRGAWSAAAAQSGSPPAASFGSAASNVAALRSPLPLTHGAGPVPVDARFGRAGGADVPKAAATATAATFEKPGFQLPPRAVYGGSAAAGQQRIGGGGVFEQPLAEDDAFGKQSPLPPRSPAGHAVRNPLLPSPSIVVAAASTAGSPPSAASQPPRDCRSPVAPMAQPPRQQPVQPPQPEEALSRSRPVLQCAVSCSAERGSRVQAQQHAAAVSVAQSNSAFAVASSGSSSSLAAPAAGQLYGPRPAGTAQPGASALGLAGAAAAQAATQATGATPASTVGGSPAVLPQRRLYGERHDPVGATLTAVGSRQRDSYAQSLGSVAAELFGRGGGASVMLPPKVRRCPDGSGGPVAAAAAATAAAARSSSPVQSGPTATRSAYELGYSHYDRLPRSQQQRLAPPHGGAWLGAGADPRSSEPVAVAGSGAMPRPLNVGAPPSEAGVQPARTAGRNSCTAAWQQQAACGAGVSQQCALADGAGRASTSACGPPAMPHQQARPLPQQSSHGARPAAVGCEQGRSSGRSAPSAASSASCLQQQQQRMAQPLPHAAGSQRPQQRQWQDAGREADWQSSRGGHFAAAGSVPADGRAAAYGLPSSQLPHWEAGASPAPHSPAPPWLPQQPHQYSSGRPPQPSPMMTSGQSVRTSPAGPAASTKWDGL